MLFQPRVHSTRLMYAAAIAATACSRSSTPAPAAPSPPPQVTTPAPIARLGVSVDSTGSLIAIKGQSTVTLDARGSSGTGLRYSLDFGDGFGADEPLATHVYQNAGRRYKTRVVVTDSSGRTDTATTSVGVASIEGTWSNFMLNPNFKRWESRALIVTGQSARALTGQYTHPEGVNTPLVGELVGERGARLDTPDGAISFVGTPAGIDSTASTLTVVVRGGSADGLTLTFTRPAPVFQEGKDD